MSYEFKKLGEVEALEEVPEGANALIEVDGAIKRVPGSNLGGGTTDFWCGDWDDTAGGYYVLATEDAEEPITYAEFAEAVENGVVRLLWSGVNDSDGEYAAYAEFDTVWNYPEVKKSYINAWGSYLLFIDTIYEASTTSLTDTDDSATPNQTRDPWPPRG